MPSNKGSIDRQRYTPVADSSVPTPPTGDKTVFLDVADGGMKTKDDTGAVSTLGGGGSGLSHAQVLTRTLGS